MKVERSWWFREKADEAKLRFMLAHGRCFASVGGSRDVGYRYVVHCGKHKHVLVETRSASEMDEYAPEADLYLAALVNEMKQARESQAGAA